MGRLSALDTLMDCLMRVWGLLNTEVKESISPAAWPEEGEVEEEGEAGDLGDLGEMGEVGDVA